MKRNILLLFTFFACITVQGQTPVRLVDLRSEHLDRPIGLDNPVPRLSWRMEDGRQGAVQTSWRILHSHPLEESPVAPERAPRVRAGWLKRFVPAERQELGRGPEVPFPCWRRRKRSRPARQSDRSGSGVFSWRGFLQLHPDLASE